MRYEKIVYEHEEYKWCLKSLFQSSPNSSSFHVSPFQTRGDHSDGAQVGTVNSFNAPKADFGGI